MGSPAIFGANNTSSLLQSAMRLSNGTLINANGPKNYITNGTAFLDTSGWITFSGAAANIPGSADSGTATGLTFSRSTSSPLSGVASFSMVQANSTSLQGKGASYAFDIDTCDQASVLAIQFNFNASSTFVASNGTTAPNNDGLSSTNAGNSDVEIFIYDRTNGALLPVSPAVITANGANNFVFKGTFQTAPNSTAYRLIFYAATASANATGWTFKYDNVFVGPQFVSQGPVVTDWTTDRTFTWNGVGTITSSTIESRRIGDTLHARGSFLAGTVSGTTCSVTLPLPVNSSKMSTNTGGSFQGIIFGGDNTNRNVFGGNSVTDDILFYDGSATTTLFVAKTSGVTPNQFDKAAGNTIFGTGQLISFEFSYPVAGWSSNTLVSNDAATRVVAMTAIRNGGSFNNTVITGWTTVAQDTHGAFNASSGVYTCPVSGTFFITTTQGGSASGNNAGIRKNGSPVIFGGAGTGSTTSILLPCIAGDTLSVQTSTSTTLNSDNTSTIFSVSQVQGPANIAVTDSVNARYYASATAISGSPATIVWTTRDFDSFNAMSSGVYTCPVAGKYLVASQLTFTGTFVLGNDADIYIQKNGTTIKQGTNRAMGSVAIVGCQATAILNCLAGDTIRIQGDCGGTLPVLAAGNLLSDVNITRVGN